MDDVEHAWELRAPGDVPYWTHGLLNCLNVFQPTVTAAAMSARGEVQWWTFCQSAGIQVGPLMASRCCTGVVRSEGMAG